MLGTALDAAIAAIKDVGFPIFVAVYVLVGIRPVLNKLSQSITTLMVVTAKSNGMQARTVQEIVDRVAAKSKRRRRASDILSDTPDVVESSKEGDGVQEAE